MVEREIDPAFVVVWQSIGARARAGFRATAYASRAELFSEWCQEHTADVASITIEAAEAERPDPMAEAEYYADENAAWALGAFVTLCDDDDDDLSTFVTMESEAA